MKVINLEIKEITSSFSGLSTAFYTKLYPTPLSEPYLIDFNSSVCDLIGFNPSNFQKEDTIELLTGNGILENFEPYSAMD